MIDTNVLVNFCTEKNEQIWEENITGEKLVQEVVPFISKTLGVNMPQARLIFCWCLHTRWWYDFDYSPRLIFQIVPPNTYTSALIDILRLFCDKFVINYLELNSCDPLAVGDVLTPTMLLDYEELGKDQQKQVNLMIEKGYKNCSSIKRGLCNYNCFYPLSVITRQTLDDNIKNKITIPLFYDICDLSKETFDKAHLLQAKINAFIKNLDMESINNNDDKSQSIIETWKPIYKAAAIISQEFYRQVVKDSLKIACEAVE